MELQQQCSDNKMNAPVNRLLNRSPPPSRDDFLATSTDSKEVMPTQTAPPLTKNYHNKSAFESLPRDSTSHILSYLLPHELYDVSLISKSGHDMFNSDLLWRIKFNSRWNCMPDMPLIVAEEEGTSTTSFDDENLDLQHDRGRLYSNSRNDGFWKRCFINAHCNPHDLWIRHWNCVTPEDVTTVVGRTVVPEDCINERDGTNKLSSCCRRRGQSYKLQEQIIVEGEDQQHQDITDFHKQFDSPIMKCCPTCRYHPMIHPNGYSNVIEAMSAELNYAKQQRDGDATNQQLSSMDDDDPVETAEIVASAHALLCNSSPPNTNTSDLESSVSKAIHYATQYSVAKWCRNLRLSNDGPSASSLLDRYSLNLQLNEDGDESCKIPSQSRIIKEEAIRAFECASTYNRKIDTRQYQSSGMQFLSDALFFNLHSQKRLNDQTTMMRELGHDGGDSSSISELGTNFETSYHTWHVIRLTNPEFILPLTFRAYIQCPDAFTVYPSEGYLRPGETIYLTLGVRMKAFMMNEAFERIDVEREEVDAEMARIYATEGHLPFVPFAIRYMYAPPTPVKPKDFASRPSFNGNRGPFGPATTTQESVLDHLWKNVESERDVRTIYISAHVNNHFAFEEFQFATLSPFNISTVPSDDNHADSKHALPLTTNMPQIRQKSPQLFSVIENLRKETESSISGDLYRTEKKCTLCQRDWGPQSELLGRAFLLRKLECQKYVLLQEEERSNFELSLRMIPSLLDRVLLSEEEDDMGNFSNRAIGLNKICQLLYCMHKDYVIPMKAKRLVSVGERQWYAQCESYIDEVCADIQQVMAECLPIDAGDGLTIDSQQWKRRGIYKSSKCTEVIENEAAASAMYKSEPRYLQKLRSLDHNPFGTVTLGVQDDPNHASNVSMHTDMFQNDALKSFAIACLMMGNPKVLIGHGVYDRVRKPGSIIRCPSLPVDVYFRPIRSERQNKLQEVLRILEKWSSTAATIRWNPKSSPSQQKYFGFKGINFEFNEQDPDGLNLVVYGERNFQINFQTTMAHYISNVPLPGQGKLYLLSSPQYEEGDTFCASINVLYSQVQPYGNILHPSMTDTDNEDESQPQQSHIPVDQNQQIDALLALNVIMLIAMHLGWTIDDDYRGGFLLVDRRLLIATQWFANTIMTASLLASLISRKILLINPFPFNGGMQDGFGGSTSKNPFSIQPSSSQTRSSQRFLSPDECGIAALVVILFYFYIGRLSEREIGWGYERQVVGNMNRSRKKKTTLLGSVFLITQQLWDASIPYFIQRWTYIPKWRKISHSDMTRNVVHHRSMEHREHCIFDAKSSREKESNSMSRKLGAGSYMIGFACFLLSFMACSPHFSINSLTTFFCSVAYGMSLTIESFEIVRRTNSSGLLSLAKPRRLNTLVIGFILIGQLVGSSGGVLFLAEFIVTTISLLLGGAATVTARAIESWITFLCLSSTSLWGFLSARLGLLDGMRKKRRGFPSNILCASLCSGVAMWIIVLIDGGWNDVSPGEMIIVVLREQGRYWSSRFVQWYHS